MYHFLADCHLFKTVSPNTKYKAFEHQLKKRQFALHYEAQWVYLKSICLFETKLVKQLIHFPFAVFTGGKLPQCYDLVTCHRRISDIYYSAEVIKLHYTQQFPQPFPSYDTINGSVAFDNTLRFPIIKRLLNAFLSLLHLAHLLMYSTFSSFIVNCPEFQNNENSFTVSLLQNCNKIMNS